MNLTTKRTSGWGPDGVKVMLGNVCVGSVYYGLNSKRETKPYIAVCNLPSLKNDKVRVAHTDDGLKFIKAQVVSWFEHTDKARAESRDHGEH